MLKTRTPKIQTIEDENDYKLVPRRRADRRKADRRGDSRFADKHRKMRRIQGLDDIHFIPIRLGERRKGERRLSKPKPSSVDEIVILRKK